MTPMVWASWARGEAALLALASEPLAALPGHQGLAAPFGFLGTADAFDVGVAVPLGVSGQSFQIGSRSAIAASCVGS